MALMIEFGYAIMTRITASEAVKMSLMKVNQYYDLPGANKKTILESFLKSDVETYLENHNIPFAKSVEVNITEMDANNLAILNISYTYFPSFTLPQIFGGKLIPNKLTMTSSRFCNRL
ncbi:MAG: hypothetical protein MZU97_02385 [Bacillus subtilis]|nr:hypothetical protein [Bacillus subtilis]